MEEEFEKQAIDVFCENVKAWLHSLPLTPEELSEQSGVDIRTIEDILKKKITSIPSTEILTKLSDTFEIPMDELLFGDSGIAFDSLFSDLTVQNDSDSQEDLKYNQEKVIEIIKENILPLIDEIKRALDLTLNKIIDFYPDKVWLDEINKICNLVIDFSLVASNSVLEVVDAEYENSIGDQFDNLFKAFDTTKELMANNFGFDNHGNVNIELHEGAYLMAVYQLAERCSEIIGMFLEAVVNSGFITEKQIKEYLPMINFDESL